MEHPWGEYFYTVLSVHCIYLLSKLPAMSCLLAASEMTEIKLAVTALKNGLNEMRTNTDVSLLNVLRLSLKDARDQLKRRLAEVSTASLADPTVASASREARILLDEVDASFF